MVTLWGKVTEVTMTEHLLSLDPFLALRCSFALSNAMQRFTPLLRTLCKAVAALMQLGAPLQIARKLPDA